MGSSLAESCRLKGAFFAPDVFNDYRSRGDFFDVNLFTDEGYLPAHKLVLSACSDFFRDKLRQMQPAWNLGDGGGQFQSAPVMSAIYMAGVAHEDLIAILDFIYQGEVQMSLDHLDEFLLTAQRLKVKGLIQEEPESQFYQEKMQHHRPGLRVAAAIKRHMDRRVALTRTTPKKKKMDVDTVSVTPQVVHQVIHEISDLTGAEAFIGDQSEIKTELISEVKDASDLMDLDQQQPDDDEDDEENIQFEIGSWQLEMGDRPENLHDVEGHAEQGEVLIEGKSAKSFIKKIDKVFHCTLCDHSSKDKSNLVRHLRRRHTNPTFELCPHCGRTYKNKECLYNHMSSKRCIRPANFDPKDPRVLSYVTYDESDKKWSCLECGAKYRQKVNAREHVVFKHLGIDAVAGSNSMSIIDPSVSKFIEFIPMKNKWKCLSCGRMFSTSFNVSHHIQQKHKRLSSNDPSASMAAAAVAVAGQETDEDSNDSQS